MSRLMIGLIVALGFGLVLALWRIDNVSTDRDLAQAEATQQMARADSLRNTLNLTRELADENMQAAAGYQQEIASGNAETERLRRCLADGTCGLRISATCVRDGQPAAAGPGTDAGTPRLTASAEQDYSTLQQGIRDQRAQIVGLQNQLRGLHRVCKLAAVR